MENDRFCCENQQIKIKSKSIQGVVSLAIILFIGAILCCLEVLGTYKYGWSYVSSEIQQTTTICCSL